MEKEVITFLDEDGEVTNLDNDIDEIAVSISRTIQLAPYSPVSFFASCKFKKALKVKKESYYDYGFQICREQIKKQLPSNGGKNENKN